MEDVTALSVVSLSDGKVDLEPLPTVASRRRA
jgi:hypothetical protein